MGRTAASNTPSTVTAIHADAQIEGYIGNEIAGHSPARFYDGPLGDSQPAGSSHNPNNGFVYYKHAAVDNAPAYWEAIPA